MQVTSGSKLVEIGFMAAGVKPEESNLAAARPACSFSDLHVSLSHRAEGLVLLLAFGSRWERLPREGGPLSSNCCLLAAGQVSPSIAALADEKQEAWSLRLCRLRSIEAFSPLLAERGPGALLPSEAGVDGFCSG
ncbi:hypothetical protein Efla_005195 [Eimeria flavescens]